MSANNSNEPAFPSKAYSGLPMLGMTLRDYFAAKAMQAAATNPKGADGFDFKERAAWSYMQADAMIKARAL